MAGIRSPASQMGNLLLPFHQPGFGQYAQYFSAIAQFHFTDTQSGGLFGEDLSQPGGGNGPNLQGYFTASARRTNHARVVIVNAPAAVAGGSMRFTDKIGLRGDHIRIKRKATH